MSGFAWVTLATNDSYSLGALVLAHSLRQVGTAHQLAVLVTPGVTNPMRQKLATVFNVVQEVNILDSKDEINLRLLKRPELGITFTKLHCWRLTQFEKCVFLDADTLVLVNSDELFEREEFSAAPDVGWPDCFNSGVFVYRPSNGTYGKLVEFAVEKGSFDGGDQGLLNLFFSDWAHKDISKHLPFIYNMCSTASYSYLPAFKQFGADVKIVHFIGPAKPWLQYFDTETRKVHPSPGLQHLQDVLQRWWDIFCSLIHPNLTPDMSGLAGAFAQFTLGVKRTPTQDALENHLRRQGWEVGNIDYMGRDSFDNIWSKICETLASAPPQPQPVQPKSREPTPPSEPVAEKATASVTDTQQVESEKVESVPVVERIKESTLAEDIEKEKVLAEGPPKLESGDVQEVSKPEPIEKAEEEPKVEQAPQVEPESLTQLQEVPPTPKPDLVQELPEPPKAEEASKLLEPESPKVEETPSQVTAEPTAEPKPEGLQEVPVAEEPKPVEKTTATAESVALKPEEPAVLDEPPKLEEPVKQEVSAPKAEELPKPEEAPKIDEPVKPEEPPKPEEPQKTKPEETPKLEDLPKPEEPPKLEESPKPEEPPKQEEPPKPEEPPKLEELPKPEEPPKQEEPPKPEESSKQEEPQKQEEPPKQEERPKQEEPPKPEEVLKQEPIVPVAKAETPQAVPKPEVSQESPLQVQEVSPAVEGVPKSEAQQEIQKVVAPKKSVEPESAKQKPEVKSSETEKKKEGGAAAEKVQEPAEEAEKPKEAKPKEKKVIKKVVKKVPKADPAQQESSEPAKPSSAAAKPTESETPPAEGSSDATPTPPPRKTTIVKKVKPKK